MQICMRTYVRNLFLDIHLNVMMAKTLRVLPFGVFMIKCGECSNHHEKNVMHFIDKVTEIPLA